MHNLVHFVEGARVDCAADTAVVGAISNPQITTTPPLSIQRTPLHATTCTSIESTKQKKWEHTSCRVITNPQITPPLINLMYVPVIGQTTDKYITNQILLKSQAIVTSPSIVQRFHNSLNFIAPTRTLWVKSCKSTTPTMYVLHTTKDVLLAFHKRRVWCCHGPQFFSSSIFLLVFLNFFLQYISLKYFLRI